MDGDNSTDLARELMNILRQFKKINFNVMDHHEVTHSEIMLLNVLKRELKNKEDKGVKASKLSEICDVTRSSITQTIGNLEQSGYVLRTMDESDRRSIRVKLTQKGENLFKKHQEETDKFIEELSDYLGNEEVQQLIESLKKIKEFLLIRKKN